jgi:hypothetical protein
MAHMPLKNPDRRPDRHSYTIAELLLLVVAVALVASLVMLGIEATRWAFSPYITELAITRDGGRVLAAWSDGSVVAWDTATNQKDVVVQPSHTVDRSSKFSADGRWLLQRRLKPNAARQTVVVRRRTARRFGTRAEVASIARPSVQPPAATIATPRPGF